MNPVGDKYDAEKDFEAFRKLFNAQYTVTNLKVIGIGQGATFVNQTLAAEAGHAIAGILSIGGKPAKTKAYAHPVPAVLAGKARPRPRNRTWRPTSPWNRRSRC